MLALLAACAPAMYVVPPGTQTASLRIENQSPPIFAYELEADTFQDSGSCSGRLLVASPRELPQRVPHTVQVASGSAFTLLLRASGGGASRAESCVLAGTFTPLPGEHYVALFRVAERRCELLLLRQQSSPGGGRRYVDEATYRERRDAACLGASAPSSIPARAGAPPLPPGSSAPPEPRLPPR